MHRVVGGLLELAEELVERLARPLELLHQPVVLLRDRVPAGAARNVVRQGGVDRADLLPERVLRVACGGRDAGDDARSGHPPGLRLLAAEQAVPEILRVVASLAAAGLVEYRLR